MTRGMERRVHMNYSQYPNFYNNNNMYNPYQQQQQIQPQMPQGLFGKVVDNKEIVTVTEVPIGGYGVFPKADMSEIYVKTWNQQGSTQIIKYVPIIEENKKEAPASTETILSKLDNIEKMLSARQEPQEKVKVDLNEL
jgi:hypothetical protein